MRHGKSRNIRDGRGISEKRGGFWAILLLDMADVEDYKGIARAIPLCFLLSLCPGRNSTPTGATV
jgi:hypothetical protein